MSQDRAGKDDRVDGVAAPEVLAGRYELGPVIGTGGMGQIRRAHDRRLGRDVAIKFLRADVADGLDGRRRFEDEARSAARLSHPNAVTVFDTGEHDGAAYIVMECLPGRTLADEIAVGQVDPERARRLATAVLGALGAAHDLGILHRDIKPANILLDAGGTPKVADFGIAKSTESSQRTSTGMVVGTTAYLPPERLHGHPATPQSDLYALGVVLYEAITGRVPFTGESPGAVVHAVQVTEPPPVADVRPGIDPDLSAAIARAMAKDPAHRFRSAPEMAAALSGGATALAGSDGAQARTVPLAKATEVVPAAVRRRPVVAVAAAVLAVALVALLALVVIGDDGGGDLGPGPSTTVTPGGGGSDTLPPDLDRALRQLEEAVRS